MKSNPINEKINSSLRSVFRYTQMTETNMPEIIIDAEADILERRISNLTASELCCLVAMWPGYLAEQTAITEIEDKRFNEYMMTVN